MIIKKTIKCVHCENELVVDSLNESVVTCTCGVVSINSGTIVEGTIGVDWVDVTPKLLNE